ncbi:DUF6049 family protein [Nocardioides sp.]|uniref:DUF6049 family protein n=1 Tax=Nocardioides sp. TaxID=35761 RepID=UPI0026286061|nr:DUF6049 family protein [Nocardioides sp.]
MVPRSSTPALRGLATLVGAGVLALSTLPGAVGATSSSSGRASDRGLLAAAAGPAPAAPANVLATARRKVDREPLEPLHVTIEELTPGEIPGVGTIEVSGTVTNVDDETWTTLNLYPVIGDAPMTTAAELRAARRSDPLGFVGERVTDPGPYAVVDRLEPGATASYSFTVARSRLGVTERGVYWFAVHVLGQDTAGRDSTADGRARTFLPLVDQPPAQGRRPDGATVVEPVPVAVVVPIRRRVLHRADGSLAETQEWIEDLGPGGTLGRLVDSAAAAGGSPLTWLVDPALTTAAAQLAAGNPPRSIAPTVDPTTGEEEPPEPTGTASASEGTDPSGGTTGSRDGSGSPDGSDGSDDAASPSPSTSLVPEPVDPEDLDPEARAAARVATDWLDDLTAAQSGTQQVLALPFGDLDVSGAAERAPELYARARQLGGATLPGLPEAEVATEPGISSPLGYLDPDAVAMASSDETLLLTDLEVGIGPDGTAPALASVDGRTVVVASSGAAQGGPGPGRRLSTVSVRQRILSEAAVRLLQDEPEPLVVVLPPGWSPDDPEALLPPLDTTWVDLDTVSDAVAGVQPTEVDPATLNYPGSQEVAELSPAMVRAVEDQIAAGEVLEEVLTLNDQVGDVLAGEAFAAASYTTRPVRRTARASAEATTARVRGLLEQVGVTTPPGVTLSSLSGRLPITIVNDLDQPVTVSLDAQSDLPMSLTVPDEIEVGAGGRASVLLEASTTRQAVHNVSLLVTSPSGEPLGARAELPIRSAQVSNVIWLIMGSGAVLLFGMIGLRLVRRVREARRTAGP